jgi:hypothetical protein
MSLNRDDILQAQDVHVEKVFVPEWAKDKNKPKEAFVFVKNMTGDERDLYEGSILRDKKGNVVMEQVRAKLVACTACDENGELLFTTKDIAALGKKSAAALQRVFDAAVKLNAISKQDIDELADNLEKNPLDGSASD